MNPLMFPIFSGRGGGKAYSAECFGDFLNRQKELVDKQKELKP